MFWKKKTTDAKAVFPTEPPRPILKAQPDHMGGPSIRFAQERRNPLTTPRVVVSQYEPTQPVCDPFPMPSLVRSPSPRRSSRPTSPSATSFGSRPYSHHDSSSSPSAPIWQQQPTSSFAPRPKSATSPLNTPPMPSSHVTTPPTAYVSTMQTRAPPPPSPYRPTHERSRSITRSSTLPEPLPMTSDMAPRPPRHSSLFPNSESMHTLPDTNVPMLNIIPATPQDASEEWTMTEPKRKRLSLSLQDSAEIDENEMEEIPLDPPTMPSIDIKLDFSPFQPLVLLPLSTSIICFEEAEAPMEPLPPSPPFESYPSLPSLESEQSMPSSGSEDSMPTSSSSSSLMSFPDVEEALGSMLASLSDSSMSETISIQPKQPIFTSLTLDNPGLGLGLDFQDNSIITQPIAPLSPRRRPPPLDLSFTKRANLPPLQIHSAPPVINHRVAFYGTARAHPNSPNSGVFTITVPSQPDFQDLNYRDSISLASEASDEDLHTASIMTLTPVLTSGERALMVEVVGVGEVDDLGVLEEVGLAF